jgi:hypothetical protein
MVAGLLLVVGCQGAPTVAKVPGLEYRLDVATTPRPLRWHVLTVDLRQQQLAFASVVADDPDGAGPAEATLVDPLALAKRSQVVAAVNCNAFSVLRKPEGKGALSFPAGAEADILGLALHERATRSPSEGAYVDFWLDAQRRPALGPPPVGAEVVAGVAGFSRCVRDGKVVGGNDALHPRTAVGFSADGNTVWLVVVDGRQPGYSEGVSTAELGHYLAGLGATQALNLDGGGSSAMILQDAGGELRVVNSPSTKVAGISVARPIPNLLALRLRP